MAQILGIWTICNISQPREMMRSSIFQEVCLAAVRQNGRALRHASETQRNNKEVVDAALENCTEASSEGVHDDHNPSKQEKNAVESRQSSASFGSIFFSYFEIAVFLKSIYRTFLSM